MRVLAAAAVVFGLLLLAGGEYLLTDEVQELVERDPRFTPYWIPILGRLGPGVVAVVLGSVVGALGLSRLVPDAPPDDAAEAPPNRLPRPRLGYALIALGVLASAALCVHILTARVETWNDATKAFYFAYVRPGLFGLSVLLAGAGCALLRRREAGARLPLDRLDALCMVALPTLFAALVVPTLANWRYSFIGDEYAFYQVAYELYSARPFDPFWQAGVYSTHPLLSSWIPALTMRLFGADVVGWKLGLTAMGMLTIPITYLAGRWLFDRVTAVVAASVVATSHYLFAYSHTGHNNIDAVPWVILTGLLVGVALMRPSALVWFAAGATAGFSLYWFFAARVAGPMLALAMLQRGRRRFWDGLGPALLGCAIVAAPFIARNQTEVVTRMLVESATTKPLPLADQLVEVARLTGLAALAFHWSNAHGLYISLGLLDPISAALSAVGVGVALLRLRDWRRRTMVIWYVVILLITGGLARHSGISVPRHLVLVPLLGIFAGDAVSHLLRGVAPLVGRTLRAPLAGLALLALLVVLSAANLHRFRVVTPARNEVPPEMIAMAALYDPRCRAAGEAPLLLWHGYGGAMPLMLSIWEPNRYEPMIVTEPAYTQVPAYQRWPCVAMVDANGPTASRFVAAALRTGTGARAEVVQDDRRRNSAVMLLHPAQAAPPPATVGGRLYAVDRTNQRRGGAFGAIGEAADLALQPGGGWFVADPPNSRVTEFAADGTPVAEWGGESAVEWPVAVGGDGEGIAVVDAARKRIVFFDAGRRVVRTHDWGAVGLGLPRAITVDRDGTYLVADEAEAKVARFDRAGAQLPDARRPAAGADAIRPSDLAVAPDGSTYLYEGLSTGRVRRLAPDGRVTATWYTQIREGRLAIGPDGHVWVGAPAGRGIVRFGPNGERVAEYPPPSFIGGTGEGGVGGLAVDAQRRVIVAWRYLGVVVYQLLA